MNNNEAIIERLNQIKDVPGIQFEPIVDAVKAHLINGFTANFLQVSTEYKDGKEIETQYLEYFGSMLQYIHFIKTGVFPDPIPMNQSIDQWEALHEYFTKIQPYTDLPSFTIR